MSAPTVTWSGKMGLGSLSISDKTSKARSMAPDSPHAVIRAL